MTSNGYSLRGDSATRFLKWDCGLCTALRLVVNAVREGVAHVGRVRVAAHGPGWAGAGDRERAHAALGSFPSSSRPVLRAFAVSSRALACGVAALPVRGAIVRLWHVHTLCLCPDHACCAALRVGARVPRRGGQIAERALDLQHRITPETALV